MSSPLTKTDWARIFQGMEGFKLLNVRVPAWTLRKMRVYCAEKDVRIQDFVKSALEFYLRQPPSQGPTTREPRGR